MRMLLVMVVAMTAACTTDEDPARELAKVEACDQGVFEGEPIEQCARACVEVPFTSGPTDCRVEPGGSCSPMAAFDIDGVRGCCDEAVRVEGRPTLTWRPCID
jgi:hypothetical protein